jgi:hypothetical protein
MDRNNPAVSWLLHSQDPSIRYLALTEVLGEPEDSREVEAARRGIIRGPRVKALLSGQRSDGGFGVHPYQKWTGAHWRLVSLVELGIPADYRAAVRATDGVLRWLTGGKEEYRMGRRKNGLWRVHASMEGNALGVCSRLGLAENPRVKQLAQSLVEWQWPDGGWNCDDREEVKHSSFYETLATLGGLVEYHRTSRDKDCSSAAKRAAEFFLRHRLFRSCKTGEISNPEWLKLHYPLYWHYDILQALRILHLADKIGDPRAREALNIVEKKRLSNGLWRPGGYYWYPKGRVRVMGKKRIVSNVEVVDWGRNGPNEMITLNALRVLKAAGRLK